MVIYVHVYICTFFRRAMYDSIHQATQITASQNEGVEVDWPVNRRNTRTE
jgi:hypothetical protein